MTTNNPAIRGDYVATINEFYPHAVDVSGGSTTVLDNAGLLRMVYVNTTLSAHDVELQNDGVTKFVVPASAEAGSWFMFGDATFTEDMVVVPNAAATGSITVVCKSMPKV